MNHRKASIITAGILFLCVFDYIALFFMGDWIGIPLSITFLFLSIVVFKNRNTAEEDTAQKDVK